MENIITKPCASVDYSDKNPVERRKKMDELFLLFTEIMNKVHRVSYSERYWRILLHDYIAFSLSQYPRFSNALLIRDTILPTGTKKNSVKRLLFVYIKYFIKLFQSRGKYRLINQLLQNNDNVYISDHFRNSGIEDYPVILPDYYYYPLFRLKGRNKRITLIELSEDYSDIYLRNIIKSVPVVFVEYFDFLMKRVKLFDPQNKVFNITGFPTSYSRYIVAKYIGNGAKLYGYQHGASYGETKNHSSYYHEYKIADKYHTWGWKINEKDVPSFAFRVTPFVEKYRTLNESVKFDCLIVFGRFLSWNKDKYISKGLYFAKNIDRNKYPDIIARPRKEHRKENAISNLMFLNPYNFHFHSGDRSDTPLVVKQSKVVILLFYPSTFAFECMAVNHPILCVVENREVEDNAVPFYTGMYELGIFHPNIESVVDFMNKTEIEQWWKETLIDKRYIDFKHNFVRGF